MASGSPVSTIPGCIRSDARYRHHLHLVRHVLAGVDLRGKAVLEIGCGRGGNCYYLSQYSQAARIVGVDLCVA